MRTITIVTELEIYNYDELSEDAQKTAFKNWSENNEADLYYNESDLAGTLTHFEDESVSGQMEFLKDGTEYIY